MQPPAPTLQLPVGGLWERLAARVIDDGLIAVTLILFHHTVALHYLCWWPRLLRSPFAACTRRTTPMLITAVLLITALGPIYRIATEAIWGQTIGKRALGLRVIRITDHHVPGWWRALLRWGIPQLFGLRLLPVITDRARARMVGIRIGMPNLHLNGHPFVPLILGAWFFGSYALILLNDQHRGLHDLLAGTVVVDARRLNSALKDTLKAV